MGGRDCPDPAPRQMHGPSPVHHPSFRQRRRDGSGSPVQGGSCPALLATGGASPPPGGKVRQRSAGPWHRSPRLRQRATDNWHANGTPDRRAEGSSFLMCMDAAGLAGAEPQAERRSTRARRRRRPRIRRGSRTARGRCRFRRCRSDASSDPAARSPSWRRRTRSAIRQRPGSFVNRIEVCPYNRLSQKSSASQPRAPVSTVLPATARSPGPFFRASYNACTSRCNAVLPCPARSRSTARLPPQRPALSDT